jgi:hypothetical protein
VTRSSWNWILASDLDCFSDRLSDRRKEREPVDYPNVHTWVSAHFARLLGAFQTSFKREPLMPFGMSDRRSGVTCQGW